MEKRIVSKREERFEEWEKMRLEFKRKQRVDKRLNAFWRKNKTFPMQFGGEEETPDVEEKSDILRRISNKEASEGWRDDEAIQEVLREV